MGPLGDLSSPLTWAAAIALGAFAGVVRGVTGFGAAMVMAPPVALLLGPSVAVPLVLLLEGFAAAPMLPVLRKRARWPVLTPMIIAATVFMPLGTLLLTSLDPELTRRMIAMVVIGFSLILLTGARWHGQYRTPTGIALGSLSGTMMGATGIGGPPVILYLLSGPDDPATIRATLTFYVALASALGVGTLALRGLVSEDVLLLGAAMTPLFMVGVMFGGRIFARLSEQKFRRLTIWLMLLVSAWVLIS
jgi:uncharacterized membrane protein YfcA